MRLSIPWCIACDVSSTRINASLWLVQSISVAHATSLANRCRLLFASYYPALFALPLPSFPPLLSHPPLRLTYSVPLAPHLARSRPPSSSEQLSLSQGPSLSQSTLVKRALCGSRVYQLRCGSRGQHTWK